MNVPLQEGIVVRIVAFLCVVGNRYCGSPAWRHMAYGFAVALRSNFISP